MDCKKTLLVIFEPNEKPLRFILLDSVAKAKAKLMQLFKGKTVQVKVEESGSRRFLKEFVATVEGLEQDVRDSYV